MSPPNGLLSLLSLLAGDREADRVVPPTGIGARLTIFVAAAMAFLAVFALAFASTSGRLATRWSEELARTSTLMVPGGGEVGARVETALRVLSETPGVASARALTEDEERALLEPWFGTAVALDALPVPKLIEINEDGAGLDVAGLSARLAAEVPGARLDDHEGWRAPLVEAAGRLRLLGWGALVLIAGATAATITLAAQAALAANGQVIRVLRLVGARDAYIARAFVRRFTLRTLGGAALGTALGVGAILALPRDDVAGGFLSGLGFVGWGWLWPLPVPILAALAAFVATRRAAFRTLEERA